VTKTLILVIKNEKTDIIYSKRVLIIFNKVQNILKKLFVVL